MAGLETQILADDATDIEKATSIIKSGGLVAFPTETVYGLGADAKNGPAVASIYVAKGRPAFNPLIVHVADLGMAKRYAVFNDPALKLAAEFWPGPLSLVLPLIADHGLSELVTAGLDTVAIRVPKHPTAQAFLGAFGGPLAAPSANPSGRISPTKAAHVVEDMSGRIDAVLDGGACTVGVESTILKATASDVLMLRAGGVSPERIVACLGYAPITPDDPVAPQAPGQLQSHYAPNAQVQLNVDTAQNHEVLLGFGPDCPNAALNLSPTGDLIEAAANLFSHLRKMDSIAQNANAKTIAITPVPMVGLGLAINDRLKRAAAPRS